jgi:antitoxin (DNA-binding transcriptional repressor) of toxin-antitoxin stability system
MEHRLSATVLARNVGEVLARIRYRGDSFLIERNGEPVARIGPVETAPHGTVREGLMAWRNAGGSDSAFADALERVDDADRPPEDRWGS